MHTCPKCEKTFPNNLVGLSLRANTSKNNRFNADEQSEVQYKLTKWLEMKNDLSIQM